MRVVLVVLAVVVAVGVFTVGAWMEARVSALEKSMSALEGKASGLAGDVWMLEGAVDKSRREQLWRDRMGR